MAVTAMPARTRSVQRTKWLKLQVYRYVVFALAGIFFLVPLGAMFEFSTRGNTGQRTLEYWRSIPDYPDLTTAMIASLQLALITSLAMLVLLVPTMVWVRTPALLPWISRSRPTSTSSSCSSTRTRCRRARPRRSRLSSIRARS